MTPVEQMRAFVSPKDLKEIDRWIAKFPSNEKRSALMQTLMIVQESQGFLSQDAMRAVANYLEVQPAQVYEVATFYTMFRLKPKGRHSIEVCTNVSCHLRNSKAIVAALEEKLGINLGETTADGRFSLSEVECLGACTQAPMMQVDKDYHENLTPDVLDDVLEQYE